MFLKKPNKHIKSLLVAAIVAACLSVIPRAEICYGNESDRILFLMRTFRGAVPEPENIWITSTVRPVIEEILLREYKGLRIKYWQNNDQAVWILEETVKDATVCAGIVVSQEKIQKMEILSAEGRYGARLKNEKFTDQFKNVGYDENKRLTRSIDGISGATISVDTVSRLVQLALALDSIQRTESDYKINPGGNTLSPGLLPVQE